MPGRQRTAKSLGTRHDLNYFKHRNLLRKWQVWLSLGLPLLALVWLGAQGVRGSSVAYSAGPLSSAHAVFGKQCSTCHAGSPNNASFRKHVENSACLRCHAAPDHHNTQAFIPECGTCHREHTGQALLAKVPDESCTQCHGDLRPLGGASTQFVQHINSFNGDHPEFAMLRKPGLDPGTVAFNHYVHLHEKILGPDGKRVQLECADCHRTPAESASPWPYAQPGLKEAALTQPMGHMELDPNAGRALMLPVNYARNCAACHTLQFDKRFAASVPHEKPQIVDSFVQAQFKDYLAKDPAAWREPVPAARPTTGTEIKGYTPVSEMVQARSPQEWLNLRVAESERLLWGKTCRQCHQMEWPGSERSAGLAAAELPQVKPANITTRWFKHAIFSHESHSALQCVACHSAALTSTDTKDVLVPGIKTCQTCHNGAPTTYGHAENRCFECHQYHNWMDRGSFKGTYSLPQLLGTAQPPAPPQAKSWLSVYAQLF